VASAASGSSESASRNSIGSQDCMKRASSATCEWEDKAGKSGT
jgi:hypothetical protein